MKRSYYFSVDFQEQTIIGSKSTIEKAGRIGSPQYKELCELIQVHSDFRIVEKTIETKKNKETYHGLTFKVMEEYIKTQADSDKNLMRFAAVKRVAKAKGSLYPLTKKWFLKTFPTYAEKEVDGNEVKTLTSDLDAQADAELEEIISDSTDKNEEVA